jgi:ATP-dependent DNA helicase
MEEFRKWTPAIPVVMYHGTQPERNEIAKNDLKKNLKKGRPTTKFPVVCTSYEMVLRDRANLGSIQWEFIIIVSAGEMEISVRR